MGLIADERVQKIILLEDIAIEVTHQKIHMFKHVFSLTSFKQIWTPKETELAGWKTI